MRPSRNPAGQAFRFVLLIGIVNLFADFTYEGGRSITGPFLALLGASGAAVGFVAGFGELMGYALRSVSGYAADRTGRYWNFALIGYSINMLAVPALALSRSWPAAAVLIVLERTGRAIRRPAVETMLSYVGPEMGRGWVFGFNEALDQAGATFGPLLIALVLALRGTLRHGFALLLAPALLCLIAVVLTRLLHPNPKTAERVNRPPLDPKGLKAAYWMYVAAGALMAAGFADFALISYHFQRVGTVPGRLIPILYAVAMATGAVAALVFGRLLDRAGFGSAYGAFFLSAFSAPFVFGGGFGLALAGMILWGIGIGAQDSLLKAILADVVPAGRRATGFGLFDAVFGGAWFVGSAAMGVLYDRSLEAVVILSVCLQLAALPALFLARKRQLRKSA